MKYLVLTAVLYMVMGLPASMAADDGEQVHVSTTGHQLFVRPDSTLPAEVTLYRVASKEQGQRLTSLLINSAPKDNLQAILAAQIFAQVLSVRDYGKKFCYVLLLPPTANLTIAQPFYLRGDTKLVFDISEAEVFKATYVYARVYVVEKEQDTFTKHLGVDGTLKALTAVEP